MGEVIKGWDKGVEGMRVGDKRKITVRGVAPVPSGCTSPPLLPALAQAVN